MFFISDTHFFHTNIINLTKRPFKDYSEMNNIMRANWNKAVKPDDIVYHLGDFAYGLWKIDNAEERLKEIFNSLNGKKHLIVGNHDPESTLNLPWESISHYKEIMYNKTRIVLSHYPILEWHDCFKGSFHFHGHTHQNSPLEVMNREVALVKNTKHHFPDLTESRFDKSYKNWRNLSVEVIGYTPRHVDQLISSNWN